MREMEGAQKQRNKDKTWMTQKDVNVMDSVHRATQSQNTLNPEVKHMLTGDVLCTYSQRNYTESIFHTL